MSLRGLALPVLSYALLALALEGRGGDPFPVALRFWTAVAAWVLFLEVLGSRAAAWFCGGLFTALPAAGLAPGGLPFVLLGVRGLLLCARSREPWSLVLAVLCSLLSAAVDPAATLLLALFALPWWAWVALGGEPRPAPGSPGRLGWACASLALLGLGQGGPWGTPFPLETLLGPDTPAAQALVGASPPSDPLAPFGPSWLGLLLALAVPAALLTSPRPWFWALCTAWFYTLRLGPCASFDGELVPWLSNPLYLACYRWVPSFSRLQDLRPLEAMIALGACASVGFVLLSARRPSGAWDRWSGLLLARRLALASLAVLVVQVLWLAFDPAEGGLRDSRPATAVEAASIFGAETLLPEAGAERLAGALLSLESRGLGVTPVQAARLLPLLERLQEAEGRPEDASRERHRLLRALQAVLREDQVAWLASGHPEPETRSAVRALLVGEGAP